MKSALPLMLLPALLAVWVLPGCNASIAEPTDEAPETTEQEAAHWVIPNPADKLELTNAQWRDRLTEDQYYILRQDGTEYPHTSPLNDIKHEQTPGDFACAGCDNHLFETDHKYDSRTGWPSFDRAVSPKHIAEVPENDRWNRIEVVCARCDGHLGHVFEDGPRDTTGLRYCINGDALIFHPRPKAAHPAEEPEELDSTEQ
ncbi:MAG: peptide-methionine (R)-S-oxide reductase MsrB [Planctomycetota bacterium]